MNAPHGRLRDEDIAAVKERVRLDDLIGLHVTLKRAGAGVLKGLCPFHDEKTPSFTVQADKGFYHCFGCQESGDAVTFVRKTQGLSFPEAVEYLADHVGYTLTYDDTPMDPAAAEERAQARTMKAALLAIHTAAAQFYTKNLGTPEAEPARAFLTERGFGPDDARVFGCGYSLNEWDALSTHLTGQGFTVDQVVTAGLASISKHGTPVDRFRGRLMWPIRDVTGQVIGFGARRILDSDDGPKYLNSPETPIYKKTRVLFGLDVARKDIAANQQVVVVEGYTDVMACYAAGVRNAVASCGTAFGEEHTAVIRRLIDDRKGSTGKIIYTFDGDSAGQQAALKAHNLDAFFETRTYVAVDPNGMDPCEVRIARGDQGVVDLVNQHVPLFEFAAKTAIRQHDLTTPEGRVLALRDAAVIVAGIQDEVLRNQYTRSLAMWVGVDVGTASAEVSTAVNHPNPDRVLQVPDRDAPTPTSGPSNPDEGPLFLPDPAEPTLRLQRTALTALAHVTPSLPDAVDILERADFTNPTFVAVWDAVCAAHESGRSDFDAVRSAAADRRAEHAWLALSCEPFLGGDTAEGAKAAFLDLGVYASEGRMRGVETLMDRPDVPAADVERMSAEWDRLSARCADLEQRRTAAVTG